MKKHIVYLLVLFLAPAFGAAAETADAATAPAVGTELVEGCGDLTAPPAASSWIPTDEQFLTAVERASGFTTCSTVTDCPCPNPPSPGIPGCVCLPSRICLCNISCFEGGDPE